LNFFKFLFAIVLSRLTSPLSKDESRSNSSLTLMISHYTVIKTRFMYFCVWFSWSWGWLQMWPKFVMQFLVWNSKLVWPLSLKFKYWYL